MTPWERVLAAMEQARAAGDAYRQAVAESQRAAHRPVPLTETERAAHAARGAFHIAYADQDMGRDHVAKLRAAAAAKIAEATAEARENVDRIRRDAARELARLEPTGVEAVAARVEAADARTRVRALLDSGAEPAEIADRALRLGDRSSLRALRSEIEWILPGDGQGLTRAVAKRLGLDEDAPDATGLLRRLDDAELGLLPEAARDARAAQLRADRQWPVLEQQLAVAAAKLDSGPDLGDVLAARYELAAATGQPVAQVRRDGEDEGE